MAVVKTVDPRMYSVRWFKHYQHSFMRHGKQEIPAIFKQMETGEQKMDMKENEHCNIQGIFNVSSFTDNEFPRCYEGTTNDNYTEIKKIMDLKSKNILCLRGERLNLNPNQDSRNIGGATTEVYLSQEVTAMRELDNQLDKKLDIDELQNMQCEKVDEWKHSTDEKYNTVTGISAETLKMLGNDNSLYRIFEEKLHLVKNEMCELAMIKLQKNGGKGKLHTNFTGRARVKVERRKKIFWEKYK